MGAWVGLGMGGWVDTYIYCLPPAGGRSAPKVINAPTAQSKVINAPPTASHKGGVRV